MATVWMRTLAGLAGFLISSLSLGVPVTMTATSNNQLNVSFSVGVQPPEHNAIWLFPSTWGTFGTVEADIRLVDELGTVGSGSTHDFGGRSRFVDASSDLAGGDATVIDFSRIADGVSNGLYVFRIVGGTPGASLTFDTDDFRAETFGNSGGFPAFYPTIHRVAVVPEPQTYALMAIGLAALGFARRWKAPARANRSAAEVDSRAPLRVT